MDELLAQERKICADIVRRLLPESASYATKEAINNSICNSKRGFGLLPDWVDSKPAWVPLGPYGPYPPERRYVLVRIEGEDGPHSLGPNNVDNAVMVGWSRDGTDHWFFVIPAAPLPHLVTHWCDCLGDDFAPPSWIKQR